MPHSNNPALLLQHSTRLACRPEVRLRRGERRSPALPIARSRSELKEVGKREEIYADSRRFARGADRIRNTPKETPLFHVEFSIAIDVEFFSVLIFSSNSSRSDHRCTTFLALVV